MLNLSTALVAALALAPPLVPQPHCRDFATKSAAGPHLPRRTADFQPSRLRTRSTS